MMTKFITWKTGLIVTTLVDQVNNQANRLLVRKAFEEFMMN